jgi:hypothetical protein
VHGAEVESVRVIMLSYRRVMVNHGLLLWGCEDVDLWTGRGVDLGRRNVVDCEAKVQQHDLLVGRMFMCMRTCVHELVPALLGQVGIHTRQVRMVKIKIRMFMHLRYGDRWVVVSSKVCAAKKN